MKRLSKPQQRVLGALRSGRWVDRWWDWRPEGRSRSALYDIGTTTLRALDRAGYVTKRAEPRLQYRITDAGREALRGSQ